jgi:hypothetical protein
MKAYLSFFGALHRGGERNIMENISFRRRKEKKKKGTPGAKGWSLAPILEES